MRAALCMLWRRLANGRLFRAESYPDNSAIRSPYGLGRQITAHCLLPALHIGRQRAGDVTSRTASRLGQLTITILHHDNTHA